MKTVPLRFVAEVRSSSVDKHSHEGERPVTLCNYTDVYRGDRLTSGAELMRATATDDEVRRFHLDVGDTVLTKDSEDPSDIGISAYIDNTADDFVCGYHLAIVRPHADVHPRFLNWSLRGRRVLDHFSTHASGISRYGLSQQGLRSAPIWLPTTVDQQRIADFLDDRVARIDRIIAARRRQRSLTAEESIAELQTLVDSAPTVTRPLQALTDPTRPIQYGIVLPGPDFPEGVPIIKGGDIGSGRLARRELNRTDPEIEAGYRRSRVHPGDLIIAIRGSVGEIASVPNDLALANLTQDSARVAFRDCEPRWLQAALQSSSVQGAIAERVTGSTVKGINIADLRGLPVPVPDASTQVRIGRAADALASSMGRRRSDLTRSIDLLTEYKSSLITAAVTGDLDITTAASGIPA